MPRSADERDAISLLYAPSLFLPAAEGEEVPAPVVILQNDPANVYGILETHFRSDCLPQPDRFWRIVRSTPPIPFETWRPRVNGVQLKMLQLARLPHGGSEWARVGEAVASLAPYLQPGSTPESLLADLHAFSLSVEQWWANRRRTEVPSAATKRNAPSGYQQPNGKRPAHDDTVNDALMTIPRASMGNGIMHNQNMNGAPFLPEIGSNHGLHNMAAAPPLEMNDMQRIISNGNLVELPQGGGEGVVVGGPAPFLKQGVRSVVVLNVGGLTFSTTAATLAAVEGSYFSKLSKKAATGSVNEFFLDRSGAHFKYILDHLRCQRYKEGQYSLPQNQQDLQMLRREAAFYRLPELERIVSDALAKNGIETLDALFVQTGFVDEGSALDDAHSHLLLRLNAKLAAKHDAGFVVAHRHSGTEIRDAKRNIFYQVILRKQT